MINYSYSILFTLNHVFINEKKTLSCLGTPSRCGTQCMFIIEMCFSSQIYILLYKGYDVKCKTLI